MATPSEIDAFIDAAEKDPMLRRYGLPRNDTGNRERLDAGIGKDLILVIGLGWAVWDGKVFSLKNGQRRALDLANQLSSLVAEEGAYAQAWSNACDELFDSCEDIAAQDRLRSAQHKLIWAPHRAATTRCHQTFAYQCGHLGTIKRALTMLEGKRSVGVDGLDRRPQALHTPSGVVDLDQVAQGKRKTALQPDSREGHPTRLTRVPFDPTAKCPKWDAMMKVILPNQATRAAVQRALGACLNGRNEAQVALFFRGEGGNGKSTILRALSYVLSGYAATCKIELFLATARKDAGSATPEEVSLPGARAYIASEPRYNDILDGAKIKALTGGDRRSARALHSQAFEYTPVGIPILSFN